MIIGWEPVQFNLYLTNVWREIKMCIDWQAISGAYQFRESLHTEVKPKWNEKHEYREQILKLLLYFGLISISKKGRVYVWNLIYFHSFVKEIKRWEKLAVFGCEWILFMTTL